MRSLEDTIVAIATPPGEGGIAVLRVSGPDAAAVGARLLRDGDGGPPKLQARQVQRAWATRDGAVLDEVLALWMPAPASYTRQDVLEIQCHGGAAAARAVLDAALAAGARLADPGEFTLRAFLNGRIDLLQAEAVLDVVQAGSEEALRVHQALLDGDLSRAVETWQSALGRALALLEAHLDFAEEEVGPFDPAPLRAGLEGVLEEMRGRLASYAWGRVARDGFRVALVGAPNAGKSSLLNCLAGEARAIVSATPGTTRDAIEVRLNAGGAPVTLVDTAGLRHSADAVEQEGVRRARAAAEGADLVLLVCDGSRALGAAEREEAERLAARGARAVVNKSDLGAEPAGELAERFGRAPRRVSAHTADGVPELLADLREAAWSGGRTRGEAPLTRLRHREAVAAAGQSVERALAALGAGAFPEVAASELHGARRRLAGLLGWGTPEDVLDAIFAEFCIGK